MGRSLLEIGDTDRGMNRLQEEREHFIKLGKYGVDFHYVASDRSIAVLNRAEAKMKPRATR
jgi:hypothetical protein